MELGKDGGLAIAVNLLIKSWREATKEEERAKAAAADLAARKERVTRGIIVALSGKSWRPRKRGRQIYDKAAEEGPFGLFRLSLTQDFMKPGRPGRPRKTSLLW